MAALADVEEHASLTGVLAAVVAGAGCRHSPRLVDGFVHHRGRCGVRGQYRLQRARVRGRTDRCYRTGRKLPR